MGRAALFWLRWIAALLLVAPGAFLYATGFMYTRAYAVWAALGLYVITSLAFAYGMASTGRRRVFVATGVVLVGLWILVVIGRTLIRGFDLRMWQFFLTDLQTWIYVVLAFVEQYLVMLAIAWLAPARSKPLAGVPSEGGSLPS